MRSTTRRTAASAAAVGLTAALMLTACAPGGGPGATGGSEGKTTLTLGMTADIPGLSVLIQPSYQGWFADAAWDTLLICDELGKPSAQLATEWEYNDDRSAVDLTLREGVKFSDGSDFDAEDVEAAYKAAGEVNARFADLTFDIEDATHMTITWPQPVPTLDLILCEANVSSAEAYEAGNLDTEVVGSGPYIYDASASTQGSSYTLTKNEDYWDAETYPYDKLVLKVFGDQTAGVNALKTKQIDGILASAATVD
jgi:ABC-type transport system substrate-binding protein